MKSIIQPFKDYCFVCFKTIGLEEHHIFSGLSNRKNSEKHGLKVWLCMECHKRVHRDILPNRELKELAQQKFEETHTREEFMQIFGKNYLED